ncbi:MAG: insulinase family protein, partial [Armatimonadetes bacterium]|nr:insulinase family protein [Armatimonadota bacterium]
LNAFTDKEYTCYYARVLAEDVPLALDLLSDMYRSSRFDAEEVAREQKVVLEEIKERDDAPDDLVHDLFAETLYPDHPLGRAVIGTAETVAALTPGDLRGYMARSYGAGAVIVTVSGNCDHAQVTQLVQKHLGDLGGGAETAPVSRPVATTGIVSNLVRPTEQVNFVLGTSAFGVLDEERYALSVLNTVLGDSMGSRLFQEIREKRGLGYTIGSYANMHREGGYFAVYGGTSPDTYAECLETVRAELAKIRDTGVSDAELARARAQARSGLVMKQESMSARMSRIGASEIYYGRVVPLTESLQRMDAVTPDEVLALARTVFAAPETMNVTAIGPLKKRRVAKKSV